MEGPQLIVTTTIDGVSKPEPGTQVHT